MNRSRLPTCCVLFDLDRTLLDTAPDMTESILAYDAVRNNVLYGSATLIPLAFGKQQSEADFSRRRQYLLNYYEKNICIDTTFFLRMENVLDEPEKQGGRWGVVTNKPEFLTLNSRASLCH